MSNTTLKPLTIHPWVYVLQCAPRDGTNYPTLYVGVTLNAHQRITQHFTGSGARLKIQLHGHQLLWPPMQARSSAHRRGQRLAGRTTQDSEETRFRGRTGARTRACSTVKKK